MSADSSTAGPPGRSGRVVVAILAALIFAPAGWLAAGATVGDDADPSATASEPSVASEAEARVDNVASLWPASMSATRSPWSTTRAVIGHVSDDGEYREVMAATVDRSGRIALTNAESPPTLHEIVGLEGFTSDPVETAWHPAESDVVDSKRRIVAMFAEQPHVRDLVPDAAVPFVSVEAGRRDGDISRFVVTFDKQAFAEAHPIAAQLWDPRYLISPWQSEFVWTLDVRDDGYITRWEDPTPGLVLTWSEADEPLVMRSPVGRG
jgi:hypothetical protein